MSHETPTTPLLEAGPQPRVIELVNGSVPENVKRFTSSRYFQLSNGEVISIGPPLEGEQENYRAFELGLSKESRVNRSGGIPQSDYMVEKVAFGLTSLRNPATGEFSEGKQDFVARSHDGLIIGHIINAEGKKRYSSGRKDVEVAYEVADDWQGKGLGFELLRFAIEHCNNRGDIGVVWAVAKPSNRHSIHLLELVPELQVAGVTKDEMIKYHDYDEHENVYNFFLQGERPSLSVEPGHLAISGLSEVAIDHAA